MNAPRNKIAQTKSGRVSADSAREKTITNRTDKYIITIFVRLHRGRARVKNRNARYGV